MALFDAGVPVKRSCAGIAMGLILEGDRHAVLTDILGMEDHLGDMDFKVAGTRQGITAFQMDVKNEGVPMKILREALVQTREARMHILDTMDAALPAPRKSLSPHAPRLVRIMIPVSKIGALIGPGGKNIRRLIEGHGVEIEVEDDGSVFVSGLEADKVEAAQREIEAITAEPEVGKIYKGKVVSITDFGAFVEILPGQEGLLHISQIAEERIARVEDVLKEGDSVEVKVLEIDNNGKMRLSRKAVLKPGSELKDAGPGPRRDRDDRGGRPPWGGKSGGRPRPGRGGFRR